MEPLDRYLRAGAGQDARRRVASCFVLVEGDDPRPRGFHTLAATAVMLTALPEAMARRLPRYPLVPAALLGRLAVDAAHRGRGLGQMLLLDAMARTLRSEVAVFAMVVDAKDDAAAAFYAAHGLRPLTGDGRRLFIPMAEVARLFA